MLENKVRQFIRNTYYAENLRIVFTKKKLLLRPAKDQTSIKVW